jgi:hypothetical protein
MKAYLMKRKKTKFLTESNEADLFWAHLLGLIKENGIFEEWNCDFR